MEDIKKCTKCGRELSLDQFYKRKYKSGKMGIQSRCKDCAKAACSKWARDNPYKISIIGIKWRKNNLEKVRAAAAEWRKNNPDKARETSAQYRKDNPEKIKTATIKWRKSNSEKYKIKKGDYEKKRRAGDVDYRIMSRARSAISSALRSNTKAGHMEELLACSIEDLRHHLENQFTNGMTWENYGRHGWHIDHIIPISYFNFSDPEQQKRAWHYTNLRPMWAKDNIRKGNKIEEVQLMLI